jgi:hypothetical protein
MLQAHKTVMGCKQAHLLHRDQVVVDSKRATLEDRGKLMLARCNLVVLRLCRDAELPELVVELLHELVHGRTYGAEVVLLELLALGRLAAEEGAAREDQVRTLLVVVLLDQEVLLLRPTVVKTRCGFWPKRASTRFACFSSATSERRSGVFLSRASPV